MNSANGYYVRSCDCGCKFVLMPYHLKQRDPYARWHRGAYDMCHSCFRKWERKELEARSQLFTAQQERTAQHQAELRRMSQRAADMTFKAWGMEVSNGL